MAQEELGFDHQATIPSSFLCHPDPSVRKRRIKAGGNRKKKYIEGWVEFAEKSIAKQVARHLNGNIVGK